MAVNPNEDALIEEQLPEDLPEESQEELSEVEESQEEEISEEESSAEEESVDNLVKSERGQKRIQDLANKAKKASELENEVQDLRSRLTDESKKPSPMELLDQLKSEGLPYTGDYVKDLQVAEDRAVEKALRIFRKESTTKDSFSSDIQQIEEEFPELKKGSSSFDEDLTHEVVTLYKDSSKLNPELRLKTFVERVMKLRKQGESKGKKQSVEEIQYQESQGAIKPSSGVRKVVKDYKDMSLEELKKIVPR